VQYQGVCDQIEGEHSLNQQQMRALEAKFEEVREVNSQFNQGLQRKLTELPYIFK